MKIEDYISGSDHYLIPRDELIELFDEMVNWREESKQLKEVIDKAIDKLYCWGEILEPKFQEEMLDILKEMKKEK